MSMENFSNVKCMICGEDKYCRVITSHLKNVHSFNEHDFIEYHFNYIRNENEGICKVKNCNNRSLIYLSGAGLKIKYNKFCKEHKYCSGLSPVSLEYWIDIFKMNKDEAEEARKPYIDIAGNGVKNGLRNKTFFNPTQLDYWLKKTDGNIEEAKKLHSNRQTTFSKKKCIEKHGEVKGIEEWEKRQQKWQNSLNEKSDEEKRIINVKRSKGLVNRDIKNYSKISQELFISIFNKIKNTFTYKDVYFASLKRNGEINDNGKNDEYILETDDSFRILDFFILPLKKCIEYQGTYWHGDHKHSHKGNIERNKIRDQQIKNKNIAVLYIEEKEYKKDKEETINKCLRFIYE